MRAALVVIAAGLVWSSSALAAPGPAPAGYLFSNVSTTLTATQIKDINQMIFKPGDSAHLYASRGFSGLITRYDYNGVTGQLTNPVDILNLNGVPDGLKVISGIGFHGDDLWMTRWTGWTIPRPAAISRLRSGTLQDFATGIEVWGHTINEIQIVGDTLYTGIGKQQNTGDPSHEQVYNGTIARIGDLNNPVAVNLATTPDRNEFADSSVSDGRLRLFAGGFRNPYGVRVDGKNVVWVSDNGADAAGTFPETPDVFYKDVKLNDFGNFPPPGQPGAPVNPISPFATLGSHTGAGGFDFVPTGPDRGNALVGYVAGTATGRRVGMVNVQTRAATTFMSGFSTPTDIVLDPFGRLLISDLDGSGVYMLTSPMDADANLDRVVDINDLTALATHWHTSGTWANGDFDRNGFIDAADLGILAGNWPGGSHSLAGALTSVGLNGGAVPECNTTVVMLLICAFIRRRSANARF